MKSWQNHNKYERPILIAVLFIIQLSWLIILFSNVINYSAWVNAFFIFISVMMILYLIRKNDSPAYRMSWISLIAVFPLLGGLLYLLIGNKRPTKKMKSLIAQEDPHYVSAFRGLPHKLEGLMVTDKRVGALANYLYQYEMMPVYSDTRIAYYPNGESMMDTLLYDLKSAKKYIFIEFFIVDYGEMFEAIFTILREKVKEGVEVRFLYDDFGCLARLPKNFVEECEAMGIKALKFNPVSPILSMVYNTRDHRKFIIIDGEIGYTGGLNLADEYINAVERFGYWKDNMVRIQGAATWSITILFLQIWNAFYRKKDGDYLQFLPPADQITSDDASEGYVQPFGDSPLDNEAIGENVYRNLLDMATESVYIYTPYLVVSYELQTAIELASKRGVDVRLITPGIPDKPLVFRMTRSYYRPLIEAGARIFEYRPGFVHAKTFIVDGKIACVGTINLDFRSLYLHFENGVLMYYHPVVQQIEQDFLKTQEQSEEILLSSLSQSFYGEMLDSLLRLLAPFI